MKQYALSLLLLVTIMGCVDRGDLPPVDSYVYEIYIDSTTTSCGMDSFAIQSPWMQKNINQFMIDATKEKQVKTFLTIDHIVDSYNNDFFIEQYGWDRNRLYDCEGNILKEVDGYNIIQPDTTARTENTIVAISIGWSGHI